MSLGKKPKAPVSKFPAIEILDDNGKTYNLSAKTRDITELFVGTLKQNLQGPDKADLPPSEITLMFNDIEMHDNHTLKDVNFQAGFHKLKLVRDRSLYPALVKKDNAQTTPHKVADGQQNIDQKDDQPPKVSQIIIIQPSADYREYTITTNVTDTAAFSTIKQTLFEQTNIPITEMVLTYEGKELQSLSEIEGGVPRFPMYLFRRGEVTTDAHLGIRIAYTRNNESKVVVLNSKRDLMKVPILQLKKRLVDQVSAMPEEMVILYKDSLVADDKTCLDVGFNKRDILTLVFDSSRRQHHQHDHTNNQQQQQPPPTNIENRPLMLPPKTVRVLDHLKQREYLLNTSGYDISQAKISVIKQALYKPCSIPPAEQQLSLESRVMLDTETCRSVFPDLPEYRLSLSRKEVAIITILFDDFTESLQLSVPPGATVTSLKEMIKADPRVPSLPEGQDFILKFNEARLPPQELLGDRRVFTYSVVKLAKLTRGRRFSAPDLRTIRQYEKLAVHQPRDRWLALGFRVGAWEGLDKSSAMRPARFGRVLRQYQKSRRRSATAVAMPTDMPPSSWFRYLGYRMPVVLALTRTVCDKINNKISPPVRFKAGSAVPPSPLADPRSHSVLGVNQIGPSSSSLKQPPSTFRDPIPYSPRERTQSVTSSSSSSSNNLSKPPKHSKHRSGRHGGGASLSPGHHPDTVVNERQTVVKISEEDGFTAGQEEGYNWGQLAQTMGKTTRVSRGLRGLPAESPRRHTSPNKNASVRTQPDRGKVLPTPQAIRAAQLHQCLAPPTSVAGSRTLHSQSQPRAPTRQSMSPAMSAATGLVDRLTAIENSIDNRARASKTASPYGL